MTEKAPPHKRFHLVDNQQLRHLSKVRGLSPYYAPCILPHKPLAPIPIIPHSPCLHNIYTFSKLSFTESILLICGWPTERYFRHFPPPYTLLAISSFPIHSFGTVSVLLTPQKSLRLSICTTITPGLSLFLTTIVSLPYNKTGTYNASCSTLSRSYYKPLLFIKDLMKPATFFPLVPFL